MDEEIQDADTTTSDEIVDIDTTDDEETVSISKEELDELRKKADQFPNVVARAKAAEAKVKNQETQPKPTLDNTGLSKDDAELLILASQGLTDPDLVSELKALAKVRGKSLIETQSDPIFVKLKEAREEEAKAEKARLGAGRGSGSQKKEVSLNSPELSDKDHKALWRKQNGLD